MVKDVNGCWWSREEQVPGDAHNSRAQSSIYMLNLERVLVLLDRIRSSLSPPGGETGLFA